MTVEEFRALIAKHGGVAGTEVLDKAKDEEAFGEKTGRQTPPSRVRVKFQLKDGKDLTAVQHDDGSYDVIDGSGLGGSSDDAARKAKADADLAEANAAKATAGPTKITRTVGRQTGPEGQDLGPGRETVTKDQAEFDRTAQNDKRALDQQLYERQRQAEQDAISKGQLLIAQQRISADEAWRKTQDELERIRLGFEAERNKLTQRGQDITSRGQDISAGVTTRGQDLDYQTRLAGDTVQASIAALPYWVAPSQVARLNAISNAAASRNPSPLSLPPLEAAPLPFNPATVAFEAANRARGMTPGALALPNAPASLKLAG